MVWTKLSTFGLCGALLALSAGTALYAAQRATQSADAACRDLRTAILATLDRKVDARTKRTLVHKDLTEFERACAFRDPQAQAVFSAVDRTVLFTGSSDAEAGARRVRFVPPSSFTGHRWPGLLPPLPPPEEFRNRRFGT